MITENMLLHHAYEGFEEIARLSGVQKLRSLIDVLARIKEILSEDSLQAIVKEAANKALSLDEIKSLCYEVCLQDRYTYIGRVGSQPYCCRSFIYVNRMKGELLGETYEGLSKLLGSEIGKRILERIEMQVQRSLNKEFPDLSSNVNLSLRTIYAVTEILRLSLSTLFLPFIAIGFAISTVRTLFYPVDINDAVWRGSVAEEIYDRVWNHKGTIIRNILPKISDICTRTISDLDKVLEQLGRNEENMTQSSQEKSKYTSFIIFKHVSDFFII